jgi:hypothetical protein
MCFVCDMRISHAGEVSKSTFYEAVMRSHARLTYTQVWSAIGLNEEGCTRVQIGKLLPHIETLHALYRVLEQQRHARGAIEFESPRSEFRSGRRARSSRQPQERNDAHKLIEECMIAANVEAAKFLLKKKIPAPYRVHDKPPESKYAELLEFPAPVRLRLPPHGRKSRRPTIPPAAQGPQTRRRDAARIGAAALAERWPCINPRTSATSGWRWRPTRISPRRSAAIPTCSCIARSSMRSVVVAVNTYRYAGTTWRRVAQCSQRGRRVPKMPSVRSMTAIAVPSWSGTWAPNSTA